MVLTFYYTHYTISRVHILLEKKNFKKISTFLVVGQLITYRDL